MHIVRITGPTEPMRLLGEIDGLQIKRASATCVEDGTWRVSAYAEPDALEEVAARGLSVEEVVSEAELERERGDLFAQLDSTTYPSTPSQIEDQLGALAAAHPQLCTRAPAPNRSHEGRTITYVRVSAAESGRPVLFIGGAHAREWVPPDALLSLLQRLLDAYTQETDLVIPEFVDTAPARDIPYAEVRIPAAEVRAILERIDLYVLPLLNPDGRAFSQSGPANAMWRKNRRPALPGSRCVGVDPNRNNDIAWDFPRYYNRAGEQAVSASTDPCDFQVYIGPSPSSEPEVRNLVALLREKRIEYFVDVHSFSRKLLYPWGIDSNQTADPSQSFANAAWDDRRDGGPGGPYGEYIGAADLRRHEELGQALRDAIVEGAGDDPRARQRSVYEPEPSLALYPATGTASDFAFSLQLEPDAPANAVTSFTLECGSDADGEGGFQPVPRIYPKIEREVHIVLLTLLRHAAAQ